MKKFFYYIIMILLGCQILFARVPLVSQEEVLVGTRPLSLSSAFIASADDIHAISWNPAGLAFLNHNELTFSVPLNPIWSRDLDVGFNNFYGAAVFPLSKIYIIGIDWLHIGYSDDPSLNWNNKPELEYHEEKVTVACARKFSDKLRIGVSLKYYNMGVEYDGSSEGKGHGFGMDVGINYILMEDLKVGLLGNNIFTAVMFYDTKDTQSFMSPALRLGVAYSIIENNNIELTFDDMIHLGVEHWFLNLFCIRAGAQKEILNSGEPISVAGGTGISYKFLQIDYGLNYHPHFKVSHNASVTYRFGYKAYLIDLLDIQIVDIFASMYKSYSKKNIVTLKVKNKAKKPLKTKIGFFVKGYMDSPTEKVMVLKPNLETKVELPGVFNKEIMERTDDGPTAGQILITYEHEKEKSEDESTKQFTMYSRNAFIWDDLDKLAVFVTPQDENIKEFTRGVIQQKADQELQDEFISDNYYLAMLLFVALGEYGLTYVIDPNTPFAEISEMKNAVDYVQFPAETMKSKTGDCDDLTVLYASCLANIGIPSAFIDVPGHIYMMFHLNISSARAERLFGSSDYFIDINGEAWLPVETTMFGKPFLDALREGRESLEKWSGAIASGAISEDDVRIVPVADAWKRFPSAQIDEDIDVNIPNKKKVNKSLEEDIEKVLNFISTDFRTKKKQLEQYSDVATFHNAVGVVYAKYGLNTYAEKYLLKAAKIKKDYVSALNNLGNIYMLNGKYKKAIKYYKKALKLKPEKKRIRQNLRKAQRLLEEEYK